MVYKNRVEPTEGSAGYKTQLGGMAVTVSNVANATSDFVCPSIK